MSKIKFIFLGAIISAFFSIPQSVHAQLGDIMGGLVSGAAAGSISTDAIGGAVQSAVTQTISSAIQSTTQTISSAIQSTINPSLKRQGVFGCNDAGAYAMSIGARAARGGAYVPVNDAAVTLTTGDLLYKECVLRQTVNRQRENEIANIVNQTTKGFLKGRNGGPFFPESLPKDVLALTDTALGRALATGRVDALSPAFRDDIKRGIQRNYNAETRNSGDSLKCSYKGTPEQLKAVETGKKSISGFNDILMLADPNCIPLHAFTRAQNQLMSQVASEKEDFLTRLGWNNGIYDKEKVKADGTKTVVTPGIFVAAEEAQALTSGFRQQESANDIGQMVSSLFARIGVSIFASSGGLQGLVQTSLGAPSYLEQVVSDSAAGVRDSAINAALQILVATREIGARYLEAEKGTASVLVQAAAQLRAAENSCWNIIVPRVITYSQVGPCTRNPDRTQTCTGPFNVRIATSTVFSQAAINSQIAPLASSTAQKIAISTQSLANVDKLITDVTNSTTTNVQKNALLQLDALVAGKALPNQTDLAAAEQQQQDVNNSVSNFVTETIKSWQENLDTNIGWCNLNNFDVNDDNSTTTPKVIQMWATKWKI